MNATYETGQRVAVGRGYGVAYGTVATVSRSYLVVDMDDDNYLPGGPREIVNLSRRRVSIV